jgi:hypothetical protein
MQSLPKGDSIAAQVNSTGKAQVIVKLQDMPKSRDVEMPSKSFETLREADTSLVRESGMSGFYCRRARCFLCLIAVRT